MTTRQRQYSLPLLSSVFFKAEKKPDIIGGYRKCSDDNTDRLWVSYASGPYIRVVRYSQVEYYDEKWWWLYNVYLYLWAHPGVSSGVKCTDYVHPSYHLKHEHIIPPTVLSVTSSLFHLSKERFQHEQLKNSLKVRLVSDSDAIVTIAAQSIMQTVPVQYRAGAIVKEHGNG